MSDVTNDGLIDLGSVTIEFDPFANDTELTEEISDNSNESEAAQLQDKLITQESAAENKPTSAETKTGENAKQSFAEKLSVFEFAGAKEDIEDSSITFDELRIAKAVDFPELEDNKRVTWYVEYGKITKEVADAQGTTIAKMKTGIETSKEFLDALKKSKEKNPVCKIKPRIKAQTKGLVSYKGNYINIDEADASGKLITFFPDNNGELYEMRNTEMGKFITKAASKDILREVKVGFTPALPLIPFKQLQEIIGFFKIMAQEGSNEALANIYWDKVDKVFITDIPHQTVSIFYVKGEVNPAYEDDRYIHYMDIHSHHTMRACFSAIDDADEKATRVYAVVGNVLSFFPEIKVRISNGGKFLEIEPDVVFEGFNEASKRAMMWFQHIKFKANSYANMFHKASCSTAKGNNDGDNT